MDNRKQPSAEQDNHRIAGELSARAARKQIYHSLIPLHRLAIKHNLIRVARLLEEAIVQTSGK